MTETVQTIEVRLVMSSEMLPLGDQKVLVAFTGRHEGKVNSKLRELLEQGWEYQSSSPTQIMNYTPNDKEWWLCHTTEIVIMRWD